MPVSPPPSEHQPHPDADLASLGFIDVSHRPNVGLYLDMVSKISMATEPQQVMDAFSRGMRLSRGDTALITVSCHGLKPGHYRITRQIGDNGRNLAGTNDPWRDSKLLRIATGGFLGKIISSPQPKLAGNLNITTDLVLNDWLAPYRSMIAVPAFQEGLATHWAISFKREVNAFTAVDLEENILRANLIGTTVSNVVMNRKLRELNEKMQREVDQIAAIQKALLPRVLPKIDGLELAASYETYDVAGGDMYDFVSLNHYTQRDQGSPSDPWGFIIADVSGHGPAAATIAAMLNAILYTYPHSRPAETGSPADVLAYANQHLCAKRIDHSFVTAIVAAYNPQHRRFTFARAGHPPPILKETGQPLVRLEQNGGIPLGVLEDAAYENIVVQMKPGQTLVLYTDGISESVNLKEEMFGIEGIEQALDKCTGEPQCVVTSINEALRIHEGGQKPSDDQTIVAMKVV
ncbi:MAG: PP2C family protein-serine/threonine phosphatase [Phycisphaeraceae bacterium]